MLAAQLLLTPTLLKSNSLRSPKRWIGTMRWSRPRESATDPVTSRIMCESDKCHLNNIPRIFLEEWQLILSYHFVRIPLASCTNLFCIPWIWARFCSGFTTILYQNGYIILNEWISKQNFIPFLILFFFKGGSLSYNSSNYHLTVKFVNTQITNRLI
jgi:hypothetical protein